MATINPHSALLKLPFDQYSRQFVVTHLINEALRATPATRLKLIDLGGHKGKTPEFLPRDAVTILDVFKEAYPGYVQGDATNMTFADGEFDIATSFDVFEHIPRPVRQAFINEALRVSKIGVFIAMPIESAGGEVSGAENLLNQLHKDLYKKDHQWLKEHIDYRIPTQKELDILIAKSGAKAVSLASNQITDWQLMQTLIFAAARNPHITDSVNKLNQWYNQHIAKLELGVDPGYRRVYFVTKDKQHLARVTKAMKALERSKDKDEHAYLKIHQSTLAEALRTMAAIGREFNKVDAEYSTYRTTMQEHVETLKAQNLALTTQLDNVRHSISWRLTAPLRTASKLLRRSRAVK